MKIKVVFMEFTVLVPDFQVGRLNQPGTVIHRLFMWRLVMN